MILLYSLSIVPIGIYLLILKLQDSFSLVKWKLLLLCILYGMLSCAASFGLSRTGWFFAPVVEEVLKGLMIIWLVSRKKMAFFYDSVIYGAAVGGGFALLENILYVAFNGYMEIGTAIFRGFGSALMHIGCTALLSALLILFSREVRENRDKNPVLFYLLAFIPPVLIHWLNNMFLLSPLLQLVALIVLFVLLFIFISDYDEKLIHKWLDESINNDVALLAAIRKGEFFTTKAGKYLLTVRDNFKPEVFFDICCYVSLYMELLIISKSNLILKEAGVPLPSDDASRQENRDKITELWTLKERIGQTAVFALKPIVKMKDVDRWVLDSLV